MRIGARQIGTVPGTRVPWLATLSPLSFFYLLDIFAYHSLHSFALFLSFCPIHCHPSQPASSLVLPVHHQHPFTPFFLYNNYIPIRSLFSEPVSITPGFFFLFLEAASLGSYPSGTARRGLVCGPDPC